MKFLHIALLFAGFVHTSEVSAADDRYALLGKVLTPLFGVFAGDAESGDRALKLTVRIEQMTDLPAELAGTRAEIAVQAPDKLRLHGPLLGEDLTIVRHEQRIWVSPGAKAKALLDSARLPKADKKFKLGEFKLPIPKNQLVFLPMLFSIKDLGSEQFGGDLCRVLDVQLMAEIARSLEVEGWVARVWIRPDATPARLTLARKGWNVVLRFERVEFAATLPASTWQPTSDEAADLFELTPKDYDRLLRALTGGREKLKKRE